MPTQITFEDNHINVNVLYGSDTLSEVVYLLKDTTIKGKFNPKTKKWVLPKSSYKPFIEKLEDIDRIVISDSTEEAIEAYLKPPINIRKISEPLSICDLKVPPKLGKPPFENYQFEDIQTLLSHNAYAAFLDMGLGKSYLCLSVFNILKRRGKVNKLLLVTSNSGVYNLYKECLRFTDVPEDRITIGGTSNRRPFDDFNKDIIICSYRSLLTMNAKYIADSAPSTAYMKMRKAVNLWTKNGDKTAPNSAMVLLDESHAIADPSSSQSEIALSLAKFFTYRYLSTGTPADKEQKYYAQLKFMDPTLVHNFSYTDWTNEYFNKGTEFSQSEIVSIKPEKKRDLVHIVRKYCIRRFSKDCLNLPEHFVKKVYCTLSDKQKEIYSMFIALNMRKLDEEDGCIKSHKVKNLFPHLIMAIDNPLNMTGIEDAVLLSKISKFNFLKDHPKVPLLLDLIEEHKESKIIIWNSHPTVGDFLFSLFPKGNALLLHGETKSPKGFNKASYKDKIVDDFQNNPQYNILIVGQQVLNSSVTLTNANVQIYFDMNYVYVEHQQSGRRIYRIGQEQEVHTYILLIDKSMDVARYKNIEHKDFIDTKFLTDEYLQYDQAVAIFNMEGD